MSRLKSPFKFLDAYEKEDAEAFFGRDKEVEAIYKLCCETKLLVVYGYSGTGKTSVIKCGLANKFDETEWEALLVRKGNHILESTELALLQRLEQEGGDWKLWDPYHPKAENHTAYLLKLIEELYYDLYVPVYLIFDQFEELFIEGKRKERNTFFDFVRLTIDSALPCRILMVMREEFIGSLWNHERTVPELKDFRYRIEYMAHQSIQEEVVYKTLSYFEANQKLKADDKALLSKAITRELAQMGRNIELTYLQVLLDRFYKEEAKRTPGGQAVSLKMATLAAIGNIEDVIKAFLEEQLESLPEVIEGANREVALRILSRFTTSQRTKKALEESDFEKISRELELSVPELESYLGFLESRRIIRPV
ncbi:MAG: ATP-binding protein [Lewinellaceae bacterium]|nr:ATP-binding protein [Lewinellaceae bacterium]